MSERIYGALTEHFIRRMRNWAWTCSGMSQGFVISTVYDCGPRPRGSEARTPLLIGEAEDTHRALSLVPIRYRQAVSLFWQYEGRPMTWFGMRVGGVNFRTFEKRVIHGHQLLQVELAKQAEQVRRYREAIQEREQEQETLSNWAGA